MRTTALAAALLLLAGCATNLDTTYGSERPGSVDGASVLLRRLHDTTRLRQVQLLSPRLDRECDTIVHLADQPGPPSVEACAWLEAWLDEDSGRQVVLILRDASPAPLLCERWATEAEHEADRVGGITAEGLRTIAGRFRRIRDETVAPPWPSAAACTLFATDNRPHARPARLRIADTDVAVPALMRMGVAPLPGEGDILVEADERPWAVSYDVGEGRLLVVANASPLLDGALPDPAARRLAGWLLHEIAAYTPDVQAVAWVGHLRVREGEPEAANPMALAFTAWPLALATWHLLALVVIWLAARAWRLGRRASADAQVAASFAGHVDALAGQLAAGRDQQACARAIARAHGLHSPPALATPEAARDWLARTAASPEDHR